MPNTYVGANVINAYPASEDKEIETVSCVWNGVANCEQSVSADSVPPPSQPCVWVELSLVCPERMVKFKFWKNLIREPASNSLRNLSVSWIPFLWLRLDGQLDDRILLMANVLEPAYIDFGDQFQAAFRRFFYILPEQIPMIR